MKQQALNPTNLGIAGGLLWGVGILILAWGSLITGYSSQFLYLIINSYPGSSLTYAGGLIAGIIGFVDAFIGLWIFAWLYNWIGKKRK